jgi:hypothetical protein
VNAITDTRGACYDPVNKLHLITVYTGRVYPYTLKWVATKFPGGHSYKSGLSDGHGVATMDDVFILGHTNLPVYIVDLNDPLRRRDHGSYFDSNRAGDCLDL